MSANKLAQKLYYFQKQTRFSNGLGAQLPEEFKKFWAEWKKQKPTAVHYVEKEGLYEWSEGAQTVYPIQNVPIPSVRTKEADQGIWGGEEVIQGYKMRSTGRFMSLTRRPHFWIPNLKRSIVYSEVLDEYVRTVITRRTINLINEHYGFDHYLLKTPACDLKSLLALKIKRNILIALADKTLYPNDPEKREEIYNKYSQYLEAYTRKEIEWYGLTFEEACKKQLEISRAAQKIEPLKIKFRAELIEKLNSGEINTVADAVKEEKPTLLSRIVKPRILKSS